MIKSHFTRGTQFTLKLFTIGLILGLVACGGDDDKKPTPTPTPVPTPDVTPNTFTFEAVTDAALSTEFVSNTVTISDIDELVPISISGGEYSVDSGSFTTSAGQINDGQTVAVRVTSSDQFSTPVTATLTVGSGTTSVSDTFSVTTLAQDTQPNPFTFTDQGDATFDTEYTSNAITVADINDTASIAIDAGAFSINGGEYVTSADGVNNGDTVTVRLTSASTANTPVSAELNIGGVTDTFTVTTLEDSTAPTASIAFPPPFSKTENISVMVRGEAEDDLSAISNVQIFVNETDSGVTVDTTNNYATWSVQLPLLEGDNNIEVVVTDAAGNVSSDAAAVYVSREAFETPFPDASVSYGSIFSLAYDSKNRRIFTSEANNKDIISTELNTGIRSVVPGLEMPEGLTPVGLELDEEGDALYVAFTDASSQTAIVSYDIRDWTLINSLTFDESVSGWVSGLALDRNAENPRLYFTSTTTDFIGFTDLALSDYTVLSSNTVPNSDNALNVPYELLLTPGNRLFVTNRTESAAIYEVDTLTGARSSFSTNADAVEELSNWWLGLNGMAYDYTPGKNRLLWVIEGQVQMAAVDLTSGTRTVLSAEDPLNPLINPRSIETHPDIGYALVILSFSERQSIYAIDLVSGQRVIISKSGDES